MGVPSPVEQSDFDLDNEPLSGRTSLLEYVIWRQALRIGNITERVDHLLHLGADPNLRGERASPLIMATFFSNYSVVQKLLAAGADIEDYNYMGSLYEIAAEECSDKEGLKIAKLLVSAGAKVTQTEIPQTNPFSKEFLELYHQFCAVPSPLMSQCRKVIHRAIRSKSTKKDSRETILTLPLPAAIIKFLSYQ